MRPDQTVLADSNICFGKDTKRSGTRRRRLKYFFECSRWLPLTTADIQPRKVGESINEVRLITINASNLEQSYNEPISK